ncbi:MAG: helix-turn-helix transcriptional regulator [Proteobacteria bacterium]|nr:helix-turn-helix transcriptional regulator [Pseudomonadota bacterium]
MRESAVFVWSDRALFIGARSETAVHDHHAIELCIALDALGIDMRAVDGPSLSGVPAALVRSSAPHQLAIPGPRVAVFYVEPHSPLGAGLHRWLGDAPIAPLPLNLVEAARPGLMRLFDVDSGLDDSTRALTPLISVLSPDPPRPAVDFRVKKARRFLDERLDCPPTQAEVAAHVGLSSSRLGHLFSAQVGLPIRRYRLWMRLRAALGHAVSGTPMTDAALLAGFSDGAHFTRTCKRMFGLPPTAFAPVDAVFMGE